MMEGRRLNILFLTSWYPHPGNPVSGVFVRECAKAVALHHDVVVLFPGGAGVAPCDKGFYQISDNVEEGIRTVRVAIRRSPIPKTTFLLHTWAVFRAFRYLVRRGFRPDVIHAHVYTAGLPAVLLGSFYNIPVVITEHFTGFPRRTLGRLDVLEAKFAMKRAWLVLPVSHDLARHIRDCGIDARFEVVPNVVDTAFFFPPKEDMSHKDETIRILTVCLLTPAKGIPYLLEALAELRKHRQDFVLDVVGDGSNRNDYEHMAMDLGLEGAVVFHGIKSKLEVAQFMRRSHFFVLPSLWENLPVALIEAMASGLPIVATYVGGIPEMVTDEVGYLVPPGDAGALADALGRMLSQYRKYDRKRIAEYAAERYSYEAVGNKLDKIYKSCLLGRREYGFRIE